MTRREREQLREMWTGKRVAELSDDDCMRAHIAGYEPDADGLLVGRDPRTMTPEELEAIGHDRMSLSQAIRAKCLDCCAGLSHEVRLCPAVACPSWPYRMGSNPWRAPRSEAQLAHSRERGRELGARMRQKSQNPGWLELPNAESPADGSEYPPDESAPE
jgi:hypothetical protein